MLSLGRADACGDTAPLVFGISPANYLNKALTLFQWQTINHLDEISIANRIRGHCKFSSLNTSIYRRALIRENSTTRISAFTTAREHDFAAETSASRRPTSNEQSSIGKITNEGRTSDETQAQHF